MSDGVKPKHDAGGYVLLGQPSFVAVVSSLICGFLCCGRNASGRNASFPQRCWGGLAWDETGNTAMPLLSSVSLMSPGVLKCDAATTYLKCSDDMTTRQSVERYQRNIQYRCCSVAE